MNLGFTTSPLGPQHTHPGSVWVKNSRYAFAGIRTQVSQLVVSDANH
jgi:hypothetical protein